MNRLLLAAGMSALLISAPLAARAQQAGSGNLPAPPSASGKALPTVTLDLKDASLRAALQQLFDSAKVQYSLDNRVTGFVTLRIVDQPFENALKLIMRGASFPLRYSIENGVYIIEPRPSANVEEVVPPPSVAPAPLLAAAGTARGTHVETITLTYADPYDLAGLLGITIVPVGSRGDVILGSSGGFGAGAGLLGGAGTLTGGLGNTPLGGTNSGNAGRGSGSPGALLGIGSGNGTLLNNGSDNNIIHSF